MNAEVNIDIVDWLDSKDVLRSIRKSVFIDEQRVPEELEWDGRDMECTQFLATIDSTPVASARLTPQGQIGRMAVVRDFRGRGIGSELLISVLRQAKLAGYTQVFLHAQENVIPFYERHGFTAEGDVFMDAGIRHRNMRMDLDRN